MLIPLRAHRPGWLLSVVPCRAFGLRPQVELPPSKKAWAIAAASASERPVALIDHDGKFVAKSPTWEG